MTEIKRLIEQFKPASYDITLRINPDKLSFEGKVAIEGSFTKDTKSILLHAKKLTLMGATVDSTPVSIGPENSHNEVELTSPTNLAAGKHIINVTFSGRITADMSGIYNSDFDHNGTAKRIITTQFESHHARQAFPCIDEPAAKAVFRLTVQAPADHVIISNTPILKQQTIDELVETSFEPTPIMSSYLLAFVSGELQWVEKSSSSGTIVRTYSTVARELSHLEYSVDEAIKMLEFFEDYFGIPFPLKKLDQMALPDFDAGAMENWGLITYREVVLLSDPTNRSISSEQLISLVIAHEMSHQWFGNLVTMAWWDDLWLNESFASIMEHLALDAVHPDWKQWETYSVMDILATTSRDIHKDIQPISVEVTDPDLIETLFDPGIVYSKGGRLIKMLMDYIGEDDFKKALQSYFKKHAYQNATRHDLWVELEEASGKKIDDLMTTWLTIPGMPIVSVSQDGARLRLSQKRFIADGSSDDSVWPIPLLANQRVSDDVLTKKEQEIKTDESPLLLNTHASGHYLVNYISDSNQAELLRQLKSQQLSSEARINSLNDMALMSRSGDAPLSEALDAVMEMPDEPRFNVWQLMSRTISTAQQLTEGDQAAKSVLNDVRYHISNKQYTDLGHTDNPNDDPNTIQLRSLLLSLMLAAEDPNTLQHCDDLIAQSSSLAELPAESRPSLLASTVRRGNTDLAEQLLTIYPKAEPEMQQDIMTALSATKSTVQAKKTLEAAFEEGGMVRAQDVMRWFVYFLRNYHTRQITWDYMESHWSWFKTTMSDSKQYDFLPTYCAGVINTHEWLERYEAFFTPKLDDKLLKGNITIGLSDANNRVVWRKREEPLIKAWLDNVSDRVTR